MHCDKCGVETVAGAAFCASCGQALHLATSEPANAKPGLQLNLAGSLCYLAGFFTGILFLALEPYRRDRFVRFHAFQSIFLSVVWIVLFVGLGMLQSLLPWTLWHILATLSTLTSLALLCVTAWLMYRAYNQERFKLPILGDFAEKQA